MIPPFLRSRGAIKTSTGQQLKLPVGANSANDLAVVYTKGTTGSGNSGYPILPSRWREVYHYSSSAMYERVGWYRVPAAGLPKEIVLLAGDNQVVSKGWWGFVDVFGNVGFPTYGWLECPGGTGNHALYTRAVYTGVVDSVIFAVRVRLDEVGVYQWFAGWDNSEAGLGLTADNKIYVYVNDTGGTAVGDATSTVAIPALATGRAIWIRGSVTYTGHCEFAYSYLDVSNAESVEGYWTTLGTTVAGVPGTGVFRLTYSGVVYLGTRGPGWSDGFVGDLLSYYEQPTYPHPETNINFSEPQPAVDEYGTAEVVYPTTQAGSDTPIEEFDYNVPTPFAAAAPLIDYRNVWGDDRLVYQAFVMETTAAPTGKVYAPADWVEYGGRTAKVLTRSLRVDTVTKVTDESVGPIDVDYSGNYSVWFFALVIRGRTAVVRPPFSPQAPRMTLGCAESYTLFITDQTYRQRVEQVTWSKLKWERVLDDISKASATIPDRYGGLSCLAQVGGLVPWQYGLLIERDDQEVWRGPVINVSRKGAELQVDAADVLIRYQKRLLKRGRSFEYKQADAGLILYDILTTHAYLGSDAWELPVPQVNAQVPITRTLRPRELKMAWDLMSELFDDSLDVFVMNGVLYVWEPRTGWCYQSDIRRVLDGPYNVNYDLVYGTFTEDAWAEKPDWAIDGPGQANYVAVPGVESGEYGYRRIQVTESVASQARYGVLDFVDADRVELPEDVHPTIEEAALRARANTLIALRAFAPAVLSGGRLAESAPINVDHLRPGALWKVDIWDHGFGQLLTAGRVVRVSGDVSVTQTGLSESIEVTLSPPGWEDES